MIILKMTILILILSHSVLSPHVFDMVLGFQLRAKIVMRVWNYPTPTSLLHVEFTFKEIWILSTQTDKFTHR